MAKASKRRIAAACIAGAVPILIALVVIITAGHRLGEVGGGLLSVAAGLTSAFTVRYIMPEGDGPGSDGSGSGVGL